MKLPSNIAITSSRRTLRGIAYTFRVRWWHPRTWWWVARAIVRRLFGGQR